ncbi:LysR family transcriptional regulator [Devosia sp.]|uniref:LysR family transcriptional regulator n=1 Tax=Devosia sp. TaxID=1871048 RepID=UPI001A0E67BE|nr:LysR family transcriptional regulator [Devosia sp.]MBE0578277.1 LysR family transcriptional regulator [Devosia sp.]
MAELDELRTFIAAARIGSFAKAARQLNLSPAMVGRRIQGLEQRYGAALIERTTRSQRLTEAGQEFLGRAEAVIAATEALADISTSGPLSGRIRLTAPTTVGIRRLPPIIARFTAAHPGIIFEMSLTDRRVDLIAEGFDLAVRIGTLPSSSMLARRVGTYRFACCASPDFLARHGTPRHPADLERARCILNLNLIPRNRWTFQDATGAPLTVEVGGGIEIDNGEAQRAMAIDGAGIVYLPLDLVSDDLANGALVRILGDWSLPTLPIHTLHSSRHLVPRRVSAFIAAVAEGFRES